MTHNTTNPAPEFVPAHAPGPRTAGQSERGASSALLDRGTAGGAMARILTALQQSDVLPAVHDLDQVFEGTDLRWILERIEAHQRRARRIWEGSRPIQGTPAEARLRRMGLTGPLPATLRFHPHCTHPDGTRRPAMVALLNRGAGSHRGVHITYLPTEGTGETAAATEVLQGEAGQTVTIVDQLEETSAPVVVAESIESALALAAARLLPREAKILAALSVEGLAWVRLPEPPHKGWWSRQNPSRVVFAPDGGPASLRAAERAERRAKAEGWSVEILPAPEGARWTDVLLGRASRPEEDLKRILSDLAPWDHYDFRESAWERADDFDDGMV